MTKIVLCVLDGWGYRAPAPDNAISCAHTPNWDQLWETSPHSLLNASSGDVGLPEGQMGNSEVGHMSIGSGRIILQDLPRIHKAVREGTLAHEPAFATFRTKMKANGGVCHLLGLLSDGGVHSHISQILESAKILNDDGIPVIFHAFLDGRDTPPQSAMTYLSQVESFCADHPLSSLGTVGGRYYGMDRDNRWERIEKAYHAMVEGDGPPFTQCDALMKTSYADGINDEFVLPHVFEGYTGMKEGDGLFMTNFRSDRARQILTALLDPGFEKFSRTPVKFAATLGMVEYSETLNAWIPTLFPPQTPTETLGEVVSHAGLKQLRLAETEKYAHVTFFFNGGREETFPGEDRILIPSPKVATYDEKPEMSAFEVTDALTKAISSKAYDLIVVNYANTDMVGHTGDQAAAQKAVEAIDQCLGKIMEAVKSTGALLAVTADHGNVEAMYDQAAGHAHTAHTTNPVPFMIFNGPALSLKDGRLCDIAPTLLDLMKLPTPTAMTGQSLLL